MQKNLHSIIMLTPFFYPHLGGVEKHVLELSKQLVKKGFGVSVITRQHQSNLLTQEQFGNINIYRFLYPQIHFFGLVVIWLKMLSYLKVIKQAKIIHIHDVMIWYLPLRFLFPRKKVILTMHGWEGIYPIPQKNIWLKKVSVFLANKTICVGEYISKYYGVSCQKVIYAGVSEIFFTQKLKKQNTIVFLGRLTTDTGLEFFLEGLKIFSTRTQLKQKIIFLGDGLLKKNCQQWGKVTGYLPEVQVAKQLAKAKYCIAGGYLSALEALASGCQVIVFAECQLKLDYWQNSIFAHWVHIVKNSAEFSLILEKIQQNKLENKTPHQREIKKYSWQKMTDQYLSIYL